MKNQVLFICVVLLSIIRLNAQNFNFYVDFEPKPHDVLYHQKESVFPGANEIITLRENPKSNITIDTVSIKRYDDKGNEIFFKRYTDNIVQDIWVTIWDNDKKVAYKSYDPKMNLKTVKEYLYLDNNIVKEIGASYQGDKPYRFRGHESRYDSRNNLVEKTRYRPCKDESDVFLNKDCTDLFEYDENNKLRKHILRNYNLVSEYEEIYYHSNGVLDSIYRIQILNSERILFDIERFYYTDDSLLIKKIRPSKLWIGETPNDKDRTTNIFQYDADGNLDFATALRNQDTLVKVQYNYKNEFISCIEAFKLNEKYSTGLNFGFPYNVNKIRIKFYRDKKNRVTKKEKYHNDDNKPTWIMYWIYN